MWKLSDLTVVVIGHVFYVLSTLRTKSEIDTRNCAFNPIQRQQLNGNTVRVSFPLTTFKWQKVTYLEGAYIKKHSFRLIEAWKFQREHNECILDMIELVNYA